MSNPQGIQDVGTVYLKNQSINTISRGFSTLELFLKQEEGKDFYKLYIYADGAFECDYVLPSIDEELFLIHSNGSSSASLKLVKGFAI